MARRSAQREDGANPVRHSSQSGGGNTFYPEYSSITLTPPPPRLKLGVLWIKRYLLILYRLQEMNSQREGDHGSEAVISNTFH